MYKPISQETQLHFSDIKAVISRTDIFLAIWRPLHPRWWRKTTNAHLCTILGIYNHIFLLTAIYFSRLSYISTNSK